MTTHPNTTAAGLSGGLATLLVYLLNRYAGTSLNPVDASGIATAVAAAVLFVGRRGIKGTLLAVWNGSQPGGGSPTTGERQPLGVGVVAAPRKPRKP